MLIIELLKALLGVGGHGECVEMLVDAAVLHRAVGARLLGAVAGIQHDDDGLILLGRGGDGAQQGEAGQGHEQGKQKGKDSVKLLEFHRCTSHSEIIHIIP